MNKADKTQEGQDQLDDGKNYMPLETPMVQEISRRGEEIINDLHHGNHMDTMTKKWLSQTPSPPRIPVFYTLTKIHKPVLTGRPIISGCDGPTEPTAYSLSLKHKNPTSKIPHSLSTL